jgi:hypothetical protein
MKDNVKYDPSQIFNFAEDSYFERTSRPVYAIAFLLPFITVYEMGVLTIRTDLLNETAVLVDAFVWLQKLLSLIGFTDKLAWFAPPMAVILILLGLQFSSRRSWDFWFADIFPMALECVVMSVPLLVLTLFLSSSSGAGNLPSEQSQYYKHEVSYYATGYVYDFREKDTFVEAEINSSQKTSTHFGIEVVELTSNNVQSNGPKKKMLAKIVAGIGAGIYEELVFRLILICLLMFIFADLIKLQKPAAVILSITISALLFSVHHHVDFLSGQLNQADPFDLTRFIFRTLAGVYFAGLYAFRGFGITAGTHAVYNIIAVLINAYCFGN